MDTVLMDPAQGENAEAEADLRAVPSDDAPLAPGTQGAGFPEAVVGGDVIQPAHQDEVVRFIAPVPTGTEVAIRTAGDGSGYHCRFVELEWVSGSSSRPPENLWSDLVGLDVDWKPTPAPINLMSDATAECAQYWSSRVSRNMQRTIRLNGSWYADLPDQRVTLVYALLSNATFRIDWPDPS